MKIHVKSLLSKLTLALILLIPIFYFLQKATNHQEVQKQILGVESPKKTQSLPVRLVIPVINVDAKIKPLGVSQTGEMEAPDDSISVGWFKFGSAPGEKGSAVIAGHLDGKNGEDGVFKNLYKLKNGDELYVEDSTGKSTHFIVQGSRIYDPGFAEEIFSSNDGVHLNLITCDGAWDGTKKSYSKRLIILTDAPN